MADLKIDITSQDVPGTVRTINACAPDDFKITTDMLQADIDAGAPVNDDGTINLAWYTAWLLQQMD